MPGCYEEAKAVLRGEFASLPSSECVSDPSEGARTVYRIGDVVYKIEGDREFDNETEFQVLTDLAHYEWAPPVTLFDIDGVNVLCMPYYEHHSDYTYVNDEILYDIEGVLESWQEAHGCFSPNGDMHYGNYRIIGEDKVMVIDAAGGVNL
jgi:hypothetical protein